MGEPCSDALTVCWENNGNNGENNGMRCLPWDVLPTPLPHCQQKTWLYELTCVTLETSV